MSKDIKKIGLFSTIGEYRMLLDFINKKSQEGWHMEKMKMIGRSPFRKDESKRYVYDADFNPSIIRNKKKKEEYIQMCNEQGWEFVNSTFNGFLVFRKECKEGLTEEDYRIYTDAESTNELYSRIERRLKSIIIIFLSMELIGITLIAIESNFSLGDFLITVLAVLAVCFIPVMFISSGIRYIHKLKVSK